MEGAQVGPVRLRSNNPCKQLKPASNNSTKSLFFRAIITSLVVILGFFYLHVFNDCLISGDLEAVKGFRSIALPDTFLYASLVDYSSIFQSVLIGSVKNSIFPSLLWVITGSNWSIMLLANALISYLITVYMGNLASQYQVPPRKAQLAMIVFLLLPTTFFYSIGALKELPMALCIVAGIYYFNARKFTIVFFIATLLCLIRYQMIAIILILVFAKIFRGLMRYSMSIILLIMLFYPAFSSFEWFSEAATSLYRDQAGQLGSLGSSVEYARDHLFVISAIAILIRVFQSLFEPIITIFQLGSFYQDGYLSVYNIFHVITSIAILPYLIFFLKKLNEVLFGKTKKTIQVEFIYSFLVISLISVGGFSMVHGRYLLPFIPLIMIASLIPKEPSAIF